MFGEVTNLNNSVKKNGTKSIELYLDFYLKEVFAAALQKTSEVVFHLKRITKFDSGLKLLDYFIKSKQVLLKYP